MVVYSQMRPHYLMWCSPIPPFGGEGKDAQTKFAYKTSSTQVLFLQHVMDSLKPGGRCGIVMDEGVLFRTNENAFVQTKRKLLSECNLWCIVSLPPKVFVNAGAASKTNLLFFTKGEATEEIWYYDLSDLNITKRQPLTIAHFEEFFKLLFPFPRGEFPSVPGVFRLKKSRQKIMT